MQVIFPSEIKFKRPEKNIEAVLYTIDTCEITVMSDITYCVAQQTVLSAVQKTQRVNIV